MPKKIDAREHANNYDGLIVLLLLVVTGCNKQSKFSSKMTAFPSALAMPLFDDMMHICVTDGCLVRYLFLLKTVSVLPPKRPIFIVL